MIVTDGIGNGFSAGVLNNHRFLVDSDSHESLVTAASEGKSFNFSTGLTTLTSASASALFYLKNNEVQNLVISQFIGYANQSTGGASGVGLWEILRGPTAGTIVSLAVALTTRANSNFGSTFTLLADAFEGAEGNTLTDGTVFSAINGLVVPHRVEFGEINGVIIPRGASIGIRYTPPTGNTSIVVNVAVKAYLAPTTVIVI